MDGIKCKEAEDEWWNSGGEVYLKVDSVRLMIQNCGRRIVKVG